MRTVLIVDDNREMRELVGRIVRKASVAVFECEDGDEVLAAFALHRPDWVLMDVEMKRTDGFTSTRELTAAFPEARVVILAQSDDPVWRAAAAQAGAWGYVLKENLFSVCDLILGRSTARGERP
jgi:DNA-binding NarL/FixJ family response regulator